MNRLTSRYFLFAVLFVSGGFSQAAEPVYFRASAGLAADDAQSLPADLDDPKLLRWRQPLEAGHSSPCLSGSAIFLTTFGEEKLATVRLDRKSGKLLWKQVAPADRLEAFHASGSPAAATPACDGQRVYSFFGSYGLLCYDLAGKPLWQHPMAAFRDEFGSGSSPIVVDGKLILNEDHDLDSFLLAVDAATGKTLWKTPRDGFTRSYSTPVVWRAAGKTQIIVPGALQLVAYDLATGQKVWWVNGLARIVNTTPVVSGDMLYLATWSPGGDTDARVSMEPWPIALNEWDKNGDSKLAADELPSGEVRSRFFRIDLNQDGMLDEVEWGKYARLFELAQNSMMAIRPQGEGDLSSTSVLWQYARGLPYVPSPLVYRGIVYLVKDGGIVTALDAATGRVLKQGRLTAPGNYYASPVAGDGKVYLASERGVVSVLKAGAAWEVLSSRDFGEPIHATPAIADGRVYVRTGKAVYCFGQ